MAGGSTNPNLNILNVETDVSNLKVIKKIASDGTVTYHGDDAATDAEKFVAVKTVLEGAIGANVTVELPPWRMETNGSKIDMAYTGRLVVRGNGATIVASGTRPYEYVKISNADFVEIDGIVIDGNKDNTTANSQRAVGVRLENCARATVRNCIVKNMPNDETNGTYASYCFWSNGGGHHRYVNCYAEDSGYANYQVSSMDSVAFVNCWSNYLDSNNFFCRGVNINGTCGTVSVDGMHFTSEISSDLTCVMCDPGTGTDMEQLSLTNIVVDFPNFVAGGNDQLFKAHLTGTVILDNIRSYVTGVSKAFGSYEQINGGGVTIRNCYFASGYLYVQDVSTLSLATEPWPLKVENSIFNSCGGSLILTSGSNNQCYWTPQIFNSVFKGITGTIAIDGQAQTPKGIWKFDGNYIEFASNASNRKIFYDLPTNLAFGKVRWGNNKVVALGTGGCIVAETMSKRMAVCDMEGRGTYDCLKTRFVDSVNGVANTGTVGTGAESSTLPRHAIPSGTTNVFSAITLDAPIGAIIVNHNSVANGYAQEWIGTGTGFNNRF